MKFWLIFDEIFDNKILKEIDQLCVETIIGRNEGNFFG